MTESLQRKLWFISNFVNHRNSGFIIFPLLKKARNQSQCEQGAQCVQLNPATLQHLESSQFLQQAWLAFQTAQFCLTVTILKRGLAAFNVQFALYGLIFLHGEDYIVSSRLLISGRKDLLLGCFMYL